MGEPQNNVISLYYIDINRKYLIPILIMSL